MLEAIADIGRDPRGGWFRAPWTDAELTLREWFTAEAEKRGLDLVEDGNGNLLAWWGSPSGTSADAVLLGSHLDSVRGGGEYDGPLGVVSSFAALDRLRAAGHVPDRPVVVACFVGEEGSRFGVACVGSRLAVDGDTRLLDLRDDAGVSLAEAMRACGRDPERAGRAAWLDDIGTFVELHVEQGRGLADLDAPVGVATGIWPHGRWRFDLTGRADHAGSTRMEDRHDPMLTYATTVLAANKQARVAGQRATFGRLEVSPGSTNAIPSRVTAWLDARASSPEALDDLLRDLERQAADRAERDGTRLRITAESVSPAVRFDEALREQLASLLGAPTLPTAAGHDAGVLAAVVPTAMLFVRNPTGVSHSPEEYAENADCAAGVEALARVVEELT